MTIETVEASKGKIRTLECALCGAVRGEDFQRFSAHVAAKHTFDDVLEGGGRGGD